MKNEIEQIAQQNEMSIEFVTWFFAEKKAGCGNAWFMMMAAMWEGWKGRSIEMDKLAAENVGMDAFVHDMLTIAWQGGDVDGWTIQDAALKHGLIRQDVYCADEHETFVEDPSNFEDGDAVYFRVETPATDRIVAGIKADAKSHDLNAFISHYSAELDEHIANGGDLFDATSIRLRCFIVGGRMFREKLRDEEKAQTMREGAK